MGKKVTITISSTKLVIDKVINDLNVCYFYCKSMIYDISRIQSYSVTVFFLFSFFACFIFGLFCTLFFCVKNKQILCLKWKLHNIKLLFIERLPIQYVFLYSNCIHTLYLLCLRSHQWRIWSYPIYLPHILN